MLLDHLVNRRLLAGGERRSLAGGGEGNEKIYAGGHLAVHHPGVSFIIDGTVRGERGHQRRAASLQDKRFHTQTLIN